MIEGVTYRPELYREKDGSARWNGQVYADGEDDYVKVEGPGDHKTMAGQRPGDSHYSKMWRTKHAKVIFKDLSSKVDAIAASKLSSLKDKRHKKIHKLVN